MTISQKLCDERHDNIDKEFKRMRERMNGLDKKLWALILLMVANLGSLIAFLIKATAR